MRTIEEYQEVLKLKKEGLNNSQISKITKIPRPTVIGWVNGKINISDNKKNIEFNPKDYITSNNLESIYSYVLGLYLGDGYICQTSRTSKLRIFLDIKYDNLNNHAINKLKSLLPNNKVGKLIKKNKLTNNPSFVEIYVHNNDIKNLFPQNGLKKKHERNIILEDWQLEIIDVHNLILGLFHSDGSYYLNKNHNKNYYSFTNVSLDIVEIYKLCCEILNLKYHTCKTMQNDKLKYNVVIGGKDNLDNAYKLLGTKYDLPNII